MGRCIADSLIETKYRAERRAMKQETRSTQPATCPAESTSSPQRPKRSTGPKSLDNSNGLLWTEEKELKKALYASLQESRRNAAAAADDAKTGTATGASSGGKGGDPRQGHQHSKQNAAGNGREVSPKRTRVHAQRKFAQGSTPNSPVPTPVKVSSTNNVATDLFPSRRPKTEDFLTFLCLRGTPILPKGLDFLNSYTRGGISDSEGEPDLDSDPEDNLPNKPGEVKGKLNGLSSSLENGSAAAKKNLSKSLTPKKKEGVGNNTAAGGNATDGQTGQQHAAKAENGVRNPSCGKVKHKVDTAGRSVPVSDKVPPGGKRKSTPEQDDVSKKKRTSSSSTKAGTATGGASSAPPVSSSEKPKVSCVEALKEKYKQQRIAKKVQLTSKPKEGLKAKAKGAATKKATKPVPVPTKSSKSHKTSKTKPKPAAVAAGKRVLRSRKPLRTSCRKKAAPLGVMPHLRKAKLVPPVVDFDSDSDLESESEVPSSGDEAPAPTKQGSSGKKDTKKVATKVPPDKTKAKVAASSSGKQGACTRSSNPSPPSAKATTSPPVGKTSSTNKKTISKESTAKKKKKKKSKGTERLKRPPVEESDEDSGEETDEAEGSSEDEEDVPVRLTRSATAKEEAKAKSAAKTSGKKKAVKKKHHSEKKSSSSSSSSSGKKHRSEEEKSKKKKKIKSSASKKNKKGGGSSSKASKKGSKADKKKKDKSSKAKKVQDAKSKKHKQVAPPAKKAPPPPSESSDESDTPLSIVSSRKSQAASKSEKKDVAKMSKSPTRGSVPEKKSSAASKGSETPSKTSKASSKSQGSSAEKSSKKDNKDTKKASCKSSPREDATRDDVPLSVLAKKRLVYDQFDFSDSSDSLSDFLPLKKKRKTDEDDKEQLPNANATTRRRKVAPLLNGLSDSDSDHSEVVPLRPSPKKAPEGSHSSTSPKKSAKSTKQKVTKKDEVDRIINEPSDGSVAAKDSVGGGRGSPCAPSVPPDCPPDYVEAASYMVQEMSEDVPGLESVSEEAARTLPTDLVFGTPEDIHGLMTSEFSGVFDEAFTTGAILLTTRDTLAQIPLNFLHELTPAKTVADAATNTSEDDLACAQQQNSSTSSFTEARTNDETSVGTQTMTPVASPAPAAETSTTTSRSHVPLTTAAAASSTPRDMPNKQQQKPKSPSKASTPSGVNTSGLGNKKQRAKAPPGGTKKGSKAEEKGAREPFPLPTEPPKLVEAPVYHPSEDEFQDPLDFIKKIQPEAEKYGICKIIPPASFKPECKVNDDMRFTAHNQYVHKMLYRWGPNVQHLACIKKHLRSQGVSLEQSPLIGGIELDLSRFYHTVRQFGGLQQVIEKKKWQRVADAMHVPKAAQERVNKLYDAYCRYLVSYDLLPEEEKARIEADVLAEHEQRVAARQKQHDEQQDAASSKSGNTTKDDDDESDDDDDGDCVIKGRSTSLSSFYRIARNTMAMWYKNEPTPEEVENDFWKIVQERQQHVVVHAGNIDSSVYGSGFPSGKSSTFAKHPWNLKVLTNNPGSILRCMGPVSGVTIPTLHVGMLFTTGCWYRDPHCLPWIEYLHTGASKIWYGIPASFYEQFRVAMNKIMPYCCTSNPIWLPSDTAMVPPSLLVEQGCSLSRVVQHSGQFVVVFPGAFTSTICCGYSVSESVYFAPPEWLDLAERAFHAIQSSHEPPAFSLDRLLFCIANDAKAAADTLARLLPMLNDIRDRETRLRKELAELGLKAGERLPLADGRDKKRRSRGQDDDSEQECEVCRTHCYVSMVVNSQDETIYCLDHARQHIQKKKNLKLCKLMYTYDEEELNEIVEKTVHQIETLEQKGVLRKKSPKKKTP